MPIFQDGGPSFVPMGSMDTLTVDDTVDGVGFPTPPPWATHVLVVTEQADARYTFDGLTSPTDLVGFLLKAGEERIFPITFAQNLLAIRTGATNALWRYQFLRNG